MEEAGNTAHKHTGRPRDKPKEKKKVSNTSDREHPSQLIRGNVASL